MRCLKTAIYVHVEDDVEFRADAIAAYCSEAVLLDIDNESCDNSARIVSVSVDWESLIETTEMDQAQPE
jgi:hypothetical protein